MIARRGAHAGAVATVVALSLTLAVGFSPGEASAGSGRATSTIELRKLFPREIRRIALRTTVSVLLPPKLPWAGVVPRLYLTGRSSKDRWSITVAAAPGCGTATACFVASFEGRRGAPLPKAANVRLPGGQPAAYTAIRCGASCSPASLGFLRRGTLVTWKLKEPPKGGARALARLVPAAIVMGSR